MSAKIIKLSLFVILSVFYSLYAEIPAGYYDTATGTGYTLKTQLHNIIDGHTVRTYDSLYDDFQIFEVDNYFENDGSPLDVYSENPYGADPYNFVFGTNECGNYTSEGDCYNREHSFPKSWFGGEVYPMYTDEFHLYLTDGKVNSYRSNYPFGEVSSPSTISQNGSKVGPCSYPGYSGTVFEPIDEFKGDFARTYFYMATRYEDLIANWENFDLVNGDAVLNGTSDQVYEDWYLNLLIDWHNSDPVSQKEIDRNEGVYGFQHNRNPFIDHPEYVSYIWGGAPPVPAVNFVTASQQADESTGSLSITFSISQSPSEDVTANLILTGTALNGSDYTLSQNYITFPAYSSSNQSVTLIITDDDEPEDFESVIITIDTLITQDPAAVIGNNDQISLTINNSDGFDETPPVIFSHELINDSTLVITYSEKVDPVTSQTVANYSVDNGVGNPSAAVLGYFGDSTKVELSFPVFSAGLNYTMTINNVNDLKNNVIAANTTFSFAISTGSEGWVEYFENKGTENGTYDGSYFTGTRNYDTGEWDLLSVYIEPASAAFEGDYAVRLNDSPDNSNIITPAVNGVDSVIFYYRALNGDDPLSEFSLQKSVNGSAFTNLTSQTFSGSVYTQFAYEVNDPSDNIRLKIVNDGSAAHLIIDNFKVVTFSGPAQDTTPPEVLSHVISGSDIILTFSEILDPITSQEVTNYVLDNGGGNPSAAVLGYI